MASVTDSLAGKTKLALTIAAKKSSFVVAGIFVLAGYELSPNFAGAQVAQSICYEIDMPDYAFMAEPEDGPTTRKETWCYRNEEGGAHVVYFVDKYGRTRPELMLMVYLDGSIKQATLVDGKFVAHRARLNWSPLGVPLRPPEGAVPVPEPIAALSVGAKHGIEQSIRAFNQADDSKYRPEFTGKVEEGDFVLESYRPWRSYWYSQNGAKMHTGDNSPLAKYDRFVKERTGINPGAQAWEKRRHPSGTVGWAGHCNGWAAASTMRPEPTGPVKDPFTGIEFSVSDQKALWMEYDYCVKSVFFGNRSGGPGSDGDVNALEYHNVVTYYMGHLKQPLILDIMPNEVVENRAASKVEMKVRKIGTNSYSVQTKMTLHSYDKKINDEVGPAGVFYRHYNYTLTVDGEGRPKSASWTVGRYPDFFWQPVSLFFSDECPRANAGMHEAWLNEIHRLSQRPADKPLKPFVGLMPPNEFMPEPVDTRPPGAADPDVAAPDADAQPDEA